VLAVEGGAMLSSPYIINSDASVIGMGGFMGGDNAPSVDLLTSWKAQGKLGFVLSQAPKSATPAKGAGSPGPAAGAGMAGMTVDSVGPRSRRSVRPGSSRTARRCPRAPMAERRRPNPVSLPGSGVRRPSMTASPDRASSVYCDFRRG
jgi:hypothetical protein